MPTSSTDLWAEALRLLSAGAREASREKSRAQRAREGDTTGTDALAKLRFVYALMLAGDLARTKRELRKRSRDAARKLLGV